MQKLKNNEARPEFTGSYKKKRHVFRLGHLKKYPSLKSVRAPIFPSAVIFFFILE